MTSFGSKVALVLGGAGNIGSMAAAAFLELGEYKKVVIVSRSQEKMDKAIENIRAKVGKSADRIVGIVGDISDIKSAKCVGEKVVEAVGDKIDHVVSALGFSFMNNGPLIGVSDEQFRSVFNSQFYAPVYGYQVIMPLVKNSSCGSYVFVTGGGPDMYLGPGTGVMTVGGSANTAFVKVAMKEHAADDVACTQISFLLGICPDPSKMPQSPFTWVASADAGKALVSVASKRQADGRTLTVYSADDIKKLTENGTLEKA